MPFVRDAVGSTCSLLYSSSRNTYYLCEETTRVSSAGRKRGENLDVAQVPAMSSDQWFPSCHSKNSNV